MERDWQEIAGGITAPQGFTAAGVAAGLKPSGAADVALIYSETEAQIAGVLTTNLVKAACVTYAERVLAQTEVARAIIINAGQANACTGLEGEQDNQQMAEAVATALGVPTDQVLTASTGVIGQRLAMDKLHQGIPTLVSALSATGADAAARAIMTTDLAPKTVALETQIEGQPVRLGGMAKGSGMIHPNLATMLAFITCDAKLSTDLWRSMIRRAAESSFNQITVDGDTSTNDMFLALANGRSQAPEILADTPEALALEDMLHAACGRLAKAIARDGEGATRLVEIRVAGAARPEDARKIARVVASSPLVKSAVFGKDPNWGRVVAAAGRAGVNFDPALVDVRLGEFQLMQAGSPQPFDRKAASAYLGSQDPVVFSVDLHQGFGEGVAWGCDLSYDYIRINAEYTT